MRARHSILFLLISLGIVVAFVLDIMWGSVSLPASDVIDTLLGHGEHTTTSYVVLNFRLPKALTSLIAGAGISIAGLQMQTLFRNPLADTSILGINSGAGVGVAIYTMAYTLFPSLLSTAGVADTWGIILAACIGALSVLLMISAVSSRLHDIVSVLIVGVMIGFLASSVISILQYFSDEDTLKTYLIWSFGSVAGTTWRQLQLMLPVVLIGLSAALLMPKQMNASASGRTMRAPSGRTSVWYVVYSSSSPASSRAVSRPSRGLLPSSAWPSRTSYVYSSVRPTTISSSQRRSSRAPSSSSCVTS